MTQNKKIVSVYIDYDLHEKIKEVAKKDRQSVSGVICLAVEGHIKSRLSSYRYGDLYPALG